MNEKITYQGKTIEVVEYDAEFNGKTKRFERARRSPGVRLIIVENDTIYLSKEYRYEFNGYDFRLPGGKVFDTLAEYNTARTEGKDMIECARQAAIKEVREELGIIANNAELFYKSVCGATVEWDLYYFVVTDFTKHEQQLEEGEVIDILSVSKEEALQMCLDGRIDEERSAMTLLRYLKSQE